MTNVISTRNLTILSVINTLLSANLSAFVARVDTAWPTPASPPAVITPADFDDNIVFLKRLDTRSTRFMITRNNWSAGSKTLGTFVMTSAFNIYRCSTAGTSVTAPNHLSGIAPDVGGTASWEYIESVSVEDQSRFLTADRVPLSIASERFFFKTNILQSIKISFDIVGSENGLLPLTRQYRVTGLWADPYDRSDRVDTYPVRTTVKDWGVGLVYKSNVAATRTANQVNTHTFDIIIPA